MSVTIRATGVHVTVRAIQIDMDGERHWLPKSQISLLNGAPLGDVISFTDPNVLHEFVISDWIAEQKGFTLREEIYTASDQRVHYMGCMLYVVKSGNSPMCYTAEKRDAIMIAAALNMTQGKL